MTHNEESVSGGLGLWSAFFAGALGAVYTGLALGGPGEPTVFVITVVVGVLLIVIERVRPRRPEWRQPDGQWRNDIGHFVVGFGLGSFGGAVTAHWFTPSMPSTSHAQAIGPVCLKTDLFANVWEGFFTPTGATSSSAQDRTCR